MKNTIALLLATVCLALSLAGCGGDKSKSQVNEQQIPPADYSGEIKG